MIVVDSGIVIESRHGINGSPSFDNLVATLKLEIISFTAEQAKIAREAFHIYGKNRHPAALNICDCYAYALAKDYDAPLLFKGNDFSKTDIRCLI